MPTSLLNGEKARVSTAGFFALWKATERLSADPALGLRLGAEAAPDQFDVVAIAAAHAENLGDSLEKLVRYKRLVCPEDVDIVRTSDEAAVEFRWLLTQDAPPPRLIDACLASVQPLARYGTGSAIQPLAVAQWC